MICTNQLLGLVEVQQLCGLNPLLHNSAFQRLWNIMHLQILWKIEHLLPANIMENGAFAPLKQIFHFP